MSDALARTLQQHADRAAASGNLDRLAEEVSAFVRLIIGSGRLSRVLADGDLPADVKPALLRDLSNGVLLDQVVDLVVDVVGHGSTSPAALVATLTDVAVDLTSIAADRAGRAEVVERQLHQVAMAVQGSVELRRTLSDPGTSDASKDQLVVNLLDRKVEGAVLSLVRLVVGLDRGRDVVDGLEELVIRSAARRGLVIADVRTAIELDDDHRRRLVDAISHNIGHAVAPRFTVDPSLLGAVSVRVGDEVIDGSVRNRLEQARAAMAVAS